MSKQRTFYITTPIYYPSNKLHIGNSYTTVAADAIARFKRAHGYDVLFLTGTDEHGQKIQRQAVSAGKPVQEFVDEIVAWIKNLWRMLDIKYDDFIRTTEPRHKEKVAQIFNRFYEQGDIYKGQYKGWYCTPCESFWQERELQDGKCPDCGCRVELVAEECYYFRMSRYADRLLEYIEDHPEFIQPISRKNEMINNFLRPGLEDLSVSRTSFDWGIPVPFDSKHIIYVWLDALSNYITALNYGEPDSLVDRFWPADLHLIGKDILRFHTIYWPIFLMALGLPMPRKIFGHGWLLMEEGKMSKSKGNVVDPLLLVDRYGSDAVRYYLLREIPFGADGVFTTESLVSRINTDLANDLGNLVSRTLTMAERYFKGVLPASEEAGPGDDELIPLALDTPRLMEEAMDRLQISDALSILWRLVNRSNKYIDENSPWELARHPEKRKRLQAVIYNLVESIRFIAVMVGPYMPRTPPRIWEQIGISDRKDLHGWESLCSWGRLEPGTRIRRGEDLFPRLNPVEELAWSRPETQKTAGADISREPKAEKAGTGPGLITMEQLREVDLRVVRISNAAPVPKTDRLLEIEVDLGEEKPKRVVAGLAQHYRPSELIGRLVLYVANLQPIKLRGILSEGMLLAAVDKEGRLALTTVDQPVGPGSRIS